ncbi:MAG: transposase [Bacillota bacterium]
MPRAARQRSESGIYHIIVRGTNRQEIFHDDHDRIRYLETLKRFKINDAYKVLGWCLMSNHIHLLLQESKEDIADIMKRIGVSFVWYYNRKYNTIGHLFQDRYKSEAVERDAYLLAVIRYIHQNPVKAGIVKRPADWKWSSCPGYYGDNVYPPELLDSDLILGMFSKTGTTAIEWFKKFNEAENTDVCLDVTGIIRLTDERAREEIKRVISPLDIVEIKSLSKSRRNEVLLRVKKIKGVTQRQASRILGISQNLMFKAKNE